MVFIKVGGFMKKIVKILLVVVLSIGLFGCGKADSDAMKFKNEYEGLNGKETKSKDKTYRSVSIPKDNPMKFSTASEIVEKIDNKETFLVFFAFKECPWCRSVVEELISAAKDNEVETIYYVDVKDIRDVKEIKDGEVVTKTEGDEAYMKLIEQLDPVLDEYTLTDENGEEVSVLEKRIYAPSLVLVSHGKAQQLETGISKELTDPYAKLTDKIKKYAYKKFECMMKCLAEESAVCQKNSC